MRPVRTIVGMAVATVLAGALPAGAVGVGVGPARQFIGPEQRQAVMYVSNPGEEFIRVKGTPMLYDAEEGWVPAGFDMNVTPNRFKIRAGRQRTVNVSLPALKEDCTLLGVMFSVRVKDKKLKSTGVAIESAVLGQLAVAGRNGKESDCLSVIPSATPVAPVSTSRTALLDTRGIVGFGLGFLGLLLLAIVLRRRRQPKTYGF